MGPRKPAKNPIRPKIDDQKQASLNIPDLEFDLSGIFTHFFEKYGLL
jgi:hypothetical protein